MSIDAGDGADDVLDGIGLADVYKDKQKGVFIPGVAVTAAITDVERMPRTHPFNPNL